MGMCGGGSTCEVALAVVAGGVALLYTICHLVVYAVMKAKVHVATRLQPAKTHHPACVKTVLLLLTSPGVQDIILAVAMDPLHVCASFAEDPDGHAGARQLPVSKAKLSKCSRFLTFKVRRRPGRTYTYRLLLGYDVEEGTVTARGFWWMTSFKTYVTEHGSVSGKALGFVKDMSRRHTRATQMRIMPVPVPVPVSGTGQ
jgi:hypothetical protein